MPKVADGSGSLNSACLVTLLQATRITAGNSATLAALLSAGVGSPDNTKYIEAQLRRLVIQPENGVACHIAIGRAATDNDALIQPLTGLDMQCDGSMALAINLKGSGAVNVFQFG